MDAGEVRSWLEARAEEMADLVESLVAIDSENPPGRGLGRCGRLLRDAMIGLRLSPELIELPASSEGLEEPCVVRGSVGEGGRTVYSTGISTSCRRSRASSSGRDGRTAESSDAAAPT